jgi:hypothetical protein
MNNFYRFLFFVLLAGVFFGCSKEEADVDSSGIGNGGFLNVKYDDFTNENSSMMLLDTEAKDIFYNNSIRSFVVNKPLQVAIDSVKKLHIKFYSTIGIKNVKLLVRFKELGDSFYEFAQYDSIPAFHESHLGLSIITKERNFKDTKGNIVLIPAQPNLTNDDCEFVIECSDPYYKKIEKIDPNCKWNIRFSGYSSEATSPGNWAAMTPKYCREAVALATNMAFLFSSQEFSDALEGYKGILLDNVGKEIDLKVLKQRLIAHKGLRMGLVVNVGGLGGGETFGLAEYVYRGHYHDANPTGSNPHTFNRQAMFHEFGHCLGYSHDSNMTYGDKWTVLCSKLYVDLGVKNLLPVSSKMVLNTKK